MDDKKQNILIAGANGTTGRIIIRLLKESEKYKPIAMVRNQDQKNRFEQEHVSVVIADLEKDLSAAVKKINKVIFAAGSQNKNVFGVDQEGAKQNADNYLKKSGLIYTIVKPGALTDEKSTGEIQLKKKLENQGSISRADVAQTLVEVLEDAVTKNEVFEIIAGHTGIKKAVTGS